MPRAPYIFLKSILALACLMLTASLLLFLTARGVPTRLRAATALLESPAGVLLLGLFGLAYLLDRSP